MTKEILTVEEIRYDLRRQIRGGIIVAVVFAVFFALFAWLLVAVATDGSKWYKPFFAIVNTVFFSALPILFLTGMIICLVDVRNLHSLCQKPGYIVKDRLVGKEIKSHMVRWRYYETCHLYFASYGEYAVSGESYSWSDLYAMDSSTAYMYADCDDEYYLVLSKPHTGKILLAYNAKMFDYQPTQTK